MANLSRAQHFSFTISEFSTTTISFYAIRLIQKKRCKNIDERRLGNCTARQGQLWSNTTNKKLHKFSTCFVSFRIWDILFSNQLTNPSQQILHHISFIFASTQATNRRKCTRNAVELNYVQTRGSILFTLNTIQFKYTITTRIRSKSFFFQNRQLSFESL